MTVLARRRYHFSALACLLVVVPFIIGLVYTTRPLPGLARVMARIEGGLFCALLIAFAGYFKTAAAAGDYLAKDLETEPSDRERFYYRTGRGLFLLAELAVLQYFLCRGGILDAPGAEGLRALAATTGLSAARMYGLFGLFCGLGFGMMAGYMQAAGLTHSLGRRDEGRRRSGIVTAITGAPSLEFSME